MTIEQPAVETTEQKGDLLAEINVEIVEKVRGGYTFTCRRLRRHAWGYSLESLRSKAPVAVQVCVRGRGTVKGRCEATRAVTIPSTTEHEYAVLRALYGADDRRISMATAKRLSWGNPAATYERSAPWHARGES